MNRLFVALIIPDEIKKEIIHLRNLAYPYGNNYKWESENKIHLTLKFIGNVEDNLVEPIKNSLFFIENFNKLNCRLSRFGFFFDRKKPKILWIGLETGKELYELVQKIEKKLIDFSIPEEKRKFKTHLTLLRIRKPVEENFVDKFLSFKVPESNFTADKVVLFRSQLLHSGSEYTEIQKFYLK